MAKVGDHSVGLAMTASVVDAVDLLFFSVIFDRLVLTKQQQSYVPCYRGFL